MMIGDVAKRSGLTATTVRYYERIGLMPPPARAPNGYRDYGPEAVERLQFIRDAHESGLSLSEVASILELRSRGESTCHHVIELMERHLEEIDRQIERLHAGRDVYAGLIDRAKRMDPADCTDPDRCQTIAATTGGASHAESVPTHHWHAEHHVRGASRT